MSEPTLPTPPAPPGPPSGSGKQMWRAPGLADGEVLAGRFRIVRFIARGGMGEVYEAEDQVLRERVALKTIRPDVAGDERTMERFLREVHLARSVTHPNVSRTYDVFHHGALAFLTMELLGGQTLAERLKAGRMTPEEALPVVEQMAAALAAAHEAGVVHRDFKSANVMLEPDERRPGGMRVVVTDFGLARRDRPGRGSAAPLTETEAVLGTPDYMAPEQIEGRAITPATDVYALGVVIYEMVTGEQPFEGDTPLSVALKKLKEAAPSPRRLAPDLPPVWEKTILRCLERSPADRFASAGEVVRALRGETSVTGPATLRRRRRTIAGVAAGVVLAAAAALLVSRALSRRAPGGEQAAPARAPRQSIAVLGFKNLAGRPEEAWVSTALSEMLTTELAAGEKLRAIPSEDVARMKSDLAIPEADTLGKETLARIRRNTGADLVLLGSYLATGPGEGGPIRLDLRLQDTAAGETIAVVSEKGSAADFDALATRAGAQLRDKLRLPAVSATDAAAVKASLPSSPEAARLYAEGLAKLRVYDDGAARDLLERAVAAEPGHALAHSALAAAWSGLGYDAKALAEAKKAWELSNNLSRETRLLVEGRYRAMNNEWPRAVEIYRSLFTFFPDNLDYGLQLVRAQSRAGKPDDGLATVAALDRAFPNDGARVAMAEAETARAVSDYRRTEKAAIKAATLAEADGARLLAASARLNQAIARRNLGDPKGGLAIAEQARKLFEEAKDPSGIASAINSMANCRYDLGDLAGARKDYEKVLAIYTEVGNKRGQAGALDNIANVVGDQGDLATARRYAEQALALFREIGDEAGEAETLSNLGAALVLAGDFRGGRALFERALPLHEKLGDSGGLAIALNNVAEMEMHESEVAAAGEHFERSLKIFRDSGQKSKAVYPLVGLAGVKYETGDLAAARSMLEEGLRICRESDDKHESAYALASLGAVALAEDRADDARKNYEEALKIRTDIGESGAAEQSRIDLARLALAEGDLPKATELARAAADELGRQKLPDDEASALAVLVRALTAAGRKDDADRALARLRPLAAASQHDGVRREALLASAFARASRGDSAAAAKSLADAAARAEKQGLSAWALEARLAEGEILAKGGAKDAAPVTLSRVEKDAAARGFRRIARLAGETPGR